MGAKEQKMSYCRWSSNNWDCDLYCYESNEGFVTHVAANRVVGEIPVVPHLLSQDPDAWSKAHAAQMQFLDTGEWNVIGLASDGQTFVDDTLESFLERVKNLKVAGYHVPDFVIESIEEEIKD